MKARTGLLLATLIATAFFGLSPGFGQTVFPIESLEWLVADADYVVRGTLADVPSENDLPAHRLNVAESLKGVVTEPLTVKSWPLPEITRKGDWLFFLKQNPVPDVSPRYELFAGLDILGQECVRMDFSVISGTERVRVAVRDAMALLPKEQKPKDTWLKLPTALATSQLSRTQFASYVQDGRLSITVPVIPRLEELGRQWARSKDWEYRKAAVRALQEFRSPENIQLLKELLDDPGNFVEGSINRNMAFPLSFITVEEGGTRYYPVRTAAYDALVTWGVDVPPPVIEEPAGGLSPWTVPLLVSLPLLLFLAIITAWRRLLRRKSKSAEVPLQPTA